MHILALIGGAWLHLVGDVGLCLVGGVISVGPTGYVYDEFYTYPSRAAAAFELLPVPMGLSFFGLILARWGFAGF